MLYDCKRISYWIDRRLTGLAGPDYDATISFGLPLEPEDSQYGKSRVETFDTNQFYAAKAYADKTKGKVYSWKSEGLSNWLESGYSKANLCYLVVLPKKLPSCIDMPNDPRYEEGDDVDLEYTRHANQALAERIDL